MENVGPESLPIFEAIEKRLDEVRRRAFDLFEKRRYQPGHELEDWLKAEHEVFGWPAAELVEKDRNYEAQIALPGFNPKEVQVTVTPSEIIVHAETKHEKKIEKPNVLWTEFGSNDVYRRFELPARIDWTRPRLCSITACFTSPRPRHKRPGQSLWRSGLPDAGLGLSGPTAPDLWCKPGHVAYEPHVAQSSDLLGWE